MRDVEERARQLLEVARAGHNPGPVDAARVRAGLKARVLAEPALLQVPSQPALPPSLLRKLALAFGVGSGVGFAAGLYVAQAVTARAVVEAPATPEPVAVVAPAENAAAAAAAAREEAGAASPGVPEANDPASGEASARADASDARRKVPEQPGAASRSAKAPAANGPNPLKAELDGLRRAQELLHQGQPAWAVARLNELDRAQVGSVLLEERAATRAIAECLLGRDPQAREKDFEHRFPRSAHLEQVRASCSGAHQSGTPEPPAQPAQTENAASHHE